MKQFKSDYLNRCQNYVIRLYSPAEVAELLRCSVHYVYKLSSAGVLKPLKSRCTEGKTAKYTRSFFTDSEVIKAINFRFDIKKEEQKILKRLKEGKRLRW
jgi:hypothetical protein